MSSSVREQLRSTKFLEGVNETALHHLSKLVQAVTIEPDQILFEEGQERRLLAILVSGSVVIEKSREGHTVRLVSLGAGDAVGEGILLDDSPHGTSARAILRTEAFVLSREQVQKL